jgi:RNA polymerase sigma factor (sigma-70 family)
MGDNMTVQALRRRQPEVLGDLLAMFGRELHGVAYLITRDRADAEDIVVETLLTAYEKAGSIRDERALRAWLIRVATNQALQLRRGKGRIVRLHVVPDAPGPGDLGKRSSDRVTLLRGLEALPPRTRAAVVLRYYADLSVEEVATTLSRSPNTVKTQLREALVALRASVIDTSIMEDRHA